MTKAEWIAKGIKLFGVNRMKWKFVCPACKRITTVQEWLTADAPDACVAFSCASRWDYKTHCDYAGGGLFKLNTVVVGATSYFEYGEA